MPQGVVIAVTPSLISVDDWLVKFEEFLRTNNREFFKVGIIETCEVYKGEEGIGVNEKLLFIVPENEFPDVIPGSCDDNKATKVKFRVSDKPFKHIYEVKL